MSTTKGAYDHYELLGVTPAATTDEINAAYRKLAKQLHPDVVGDASTALFAMVADARAVLTDPDRRARYDLERSRPVVPERRPPAPRPDYAAEDIPPRPPPGSWEATGFRPSSYPPPTYQTYFGTAGATPPPGQQRPFRHGSYAQQSWPRPSATPPPRPSPPPPPPSPGWQVMERALDLPLPSTVRGWAAMLLTWLCFVLLVTGLFEVLDASLLVGAAIGCVPLLLLVALVVVKETTDQGRR
ncbi:J domain-containing protein [Pseudonocardia acaciae]|uniref:J domain-containing protein n=1 Tax=Pseudonocardia acaciae TaxID=551276 RepID=UPI00048E8A1D|nr:J domain-containing protein [Pseudonocardia acaciae]